MHYVPEGSFVGPSLGFCSHSPIKPHGPHLCDPASLHRDRCGRRSECPRADRPGQWLWSFDMEQHCLAIQSLTPSNISREEKRKVCSFDAALGFLTALGSFYITALLLENTGEGITQLD